MSSIFRFRSDVEVSGAARVRLLLQPIDFPLNRRALALAPEAPDDPGASGRVVRMRFAFAGNAGHELGIGHRETLEQD